jgi:hypothetical protein
VRLEAVVLAERAGIEQKLDALSRRRCRSASFSAVVVVGFGVAESATVLPPVWAKITRFAPNPV